MATAPIIDFGRRHATIFQGPYLEVGSKIQSSYHQHVPSDIHAGVSRSEWTGIDIEEGDGVDAIVDLCTPGVVDQLGWYGKFGTVHCHCVLEHVPDIFAMTRGIQHVLRPGGMLFVSVPFAWKIHRIPVDMWRFTPQSIDYLFPLLRFDPNLCAISTRRSGELHSIWHPPELPLGSDLRLLNRIFSFGVRLLRKSKLDMGFLHQRALLVESNLMMIGEKGTGATYTFFPASIEEPPERKS